MNCISLVILLSSAFGNAFSSSLTIREYDDLESIAESLISVSQKIGDMFSKFTTLEKDTYKVVLPDISGDLKSIQKSVTDVDAKLTRALQSYNLNANLKTYFKKLQPDLKTVVQGLPSLLQQLQDTTTISDLELVLKNNAEGITKGFLTLFKIYLTIVLDQEGHSDKTAPAFKLFDILIEIFNSFLKGKDKANLQQSSSLIIDNAQILNKLYKLLTNTVTTATGAKRDLIRTKRKSFWKKLFHWVGVAGQVAGVLAGALGKKN